MLETSRKIRTVSTFDQPDLAHQVAEWHWEEFGRAAGWSLAAVREHAIAATTAADMPRTIVLLVDDRPVGMASLVANDLDQRPDLSPWLATVFVEPASRRQGLAAHLIAAVEAEARRQSYQTLWLFTRTAEAIYARAGWRTTETFERKGRLYALMRRDLDG